MFAWTFALTVFIFVMGIAELLSKIHITAWLGAMAARIYVRLKQLAFLLLIS
jgi:hypothetical protein